jgi:hypothetical protein
MAGSGAGDGGVTTPEIRLGRWQDVLPGSYDPARAIVVTDPPYGLAATGGTGNGAPGVHSRGRAQDDTRPGHETAKGYDDTIPWAEHVRQVLELLPARRHVIRGPATALIRRDHPQPRRVCVEIAAYRRRAANRPGVVPYLWQGWAVYGRLKVDRHARQPQGDAISARSLLQAHDGDLQMRRTSHRALTPYASALWIVDNWVDPGCVVLDPFAGHGTIGRAARQHGFDYIGAEVDPEYAATAAESFAVERLTMGLTG